MCLYPAFARIEGNRAFFDGAAPAGATMLERVCEDDRD
jgi:hypothetical protein